jgi:hypothetical protein
MFNGGKINETELVYAAIDGMTNVLRKRFEDPYTVAMTPEQLRLLQESLNCTVFFRYRRLPRS